MRRSASWRAAALATALCAASAGVAAAEDMLDATKVDAIRDVLSGWGSAELDKDPDGDPLVRGRIEGVAYSLVFYSCGVDSSGCKNVTFMAYFERGEATVDLMNAWNSSRRFGKAFIDPDGDLALSMSVNLDGGVSRKNFDDTVDWWRAATSDFQSFMAAGGDR